MIESDEVPFIHCIYISYYRRPKQIMSQKDGARVHSSLEEMTRTCLLLT
jgi:hypothetical protein